MVRTVSLETASINWSKVNPGPIGSMTVRRQGTDCSEGRRGIDHGWYVAIVVAVLLAISSGGRFLFGVVLKPFSEEFGWSRADLASAVTINVILLSLLQPAIGWCVDRWGSRRILLLGVAATALMSLPLTFATALWQVYFFYGVIAAVAFAATSPVNTTKLVGDWFTTHRGLALSIATSGAAFGQLAVVPVATWIMFAWGWRASYWALAVVALVVLLPLGYFVVRDAPGAKRAAAGTAGEGAPAIPLKQAIRSAAYWQLSFGFFVCGLTMSFTSVHMVPYMLDMAEHGHATMQTVASTALSVVGGCSILGSLAIGFVADRVGHKPMLSLTYFLRGLAFTLLIIAGPNLAGIFAAAVVLGASWTSTTPLTSAISADIYGRASQGTIFGFIFTAMNVGSGVGAYLAGLDYDLTGNYRLALLFNGLMGFAAAAAIMAVKVRPVSAASVAPSGVQPALTGALTVHGDD